MRREGSWHDSGHTGSAQPGKIVCILALYGNMQYAFSKSRNVCHEQMDSLLHGIENMRLARMSVPQRVYRAGKRLFANTRGRIPGSQGCILVY